MMESQISPTGAGPHTDSECDSIDVVSNSPTDSKKKVKILDRFEFLESPEADANKSERPLYELIKMESQISPTGAGLYADCEGVSIDVVSESPDAREKKEKILDRFEFSESPEADSNKTERPLYDLSKMEYQISPTGAGLHGDCGCDSIDVVSESPDANENKVKIMDPFEFLHLPEADVSEREHHPYKGILKHLPSEDIALLTTVPQSEEKNVIQPTFPMMPHPAQWRPLSAVPVHNPGLNGTEELPAFAMSTPRGPEARRLVPYVGIAGDGAQFFMSSRGVLFPAATGEMPAHQIHTPGSGLPQGLVVATSSSTLHIPQQMAEEATRKRELRLMKNREAAKACRLRRKAYVRCLENHIALLDMQNKRLMQELEAYQSNHTDRTTS